jgi:hypothetical protein
MSDRGDQRNINMDARTSHEITRGIGDALRRSMTPSHHSDRLQILLDAFKEQDARLASERKTD